MIEINMNRYSCELHSCCPTNRFHAADGIRPVSFGILVFGFWLNVSSSLLYQGKEEEE